MIIGIKELNLSPYSDNTDADKFHLSVKHTTMKAERGDPLKKEVKATATKKISGSYFYMPMLGMDAIWFEESLSKNALRLLRLCQQTLPINSTVVTLNAQIAKDIFQMASSNFYTARKELLDADVIQPYYESKDKYWFNYKRHGFRGNPELYASHGEQTINIVEALAYEQRMKRENAKDNEGGDVGGVGDTDQPHSPKP